MYALLGLLMAPWMSGPLAQEADRATPEVEARLVELCHAGRLDAAFEEQCLEVLRNSVGPVPTGETFWPWLDSQPALRRSSLAAAAACGPRVFSNLALLREAAPADTARFPDLAAAFAASWTGGSGPEPARHWIDGWLTEGRATPGMVESFRELSARAKDLRFPIGKAPWQVLAHLADSIVPVDERAWAFAQYDARGTKDLRNLFAAVPYTLEPKRAGGPYTLKSFLTCGGPCTHNVQFAGGVFDAFGIPSGWAGGPGHTYPYWFEIDGRDLRVFRTNEIGNRSGKIRDPLSGGHVWEDRVRLMVASLNQGPAPHDHAALAAWAFMRVPPKDRAEASPILVAALEASPLCYPALRAAAEATKARQLSPGEAAGIWRKSAAEMAERHPEELADLLDVALPALGERSATFDGEISVIGRFEKRQSGRIATWRFSLWRARALGAREKLPGCLRALTNAALELAPSETGRFSEVVGDLVRIADPGKPRIQALRAILDGLTPSEGSVATNVLHARLVTAAALQRAYEEDSRGKTGDRIWVEELIAQADQRGDPGTGPVGGGGGAAFEQVSPGAILVGLRVTTAGFNGRTVIGSMQGLFRSGKAAPIAHPAAGGVRSESYDLTVPDGFVLWGIVAAGSDRVDGVQILATPGPRLRGEVFVSQWVGSGRHRAQLLGGPAGQIQALTGRAGADLDAVGARVDNSPQGSR